MKYFKIIMLLLLPFICQSQQLNNDTKKQVQIKRVDSLHNALNNASNDTLRWKLLWSLANYYGERNRDSAFHFDQLLLGLAVKNNKKLNQARMLELIGVDHTQFGRYAEALKFFQGAFEIALNPKNEGTSFAPPIDSNFKKQRLLQLAHVHYDFGSLLERVNNNEQRIFHYKESMRIGQQINDNNFIWYSNEGLGSAYYRLNNFDSALYYVIAAEKIIDESIAIAPSPGRLSLLKGDIYLKKGLKQPALESYFQGIQSAEEHDNMPTLTGLYFSLTKFYIAEKQKDSSLYYANKARVELEALGGIPDLHWNIGNAYGNLYEAYNLNNEPDSVFKYLELAKKVNDSLNRNYIKSLSDFQNLSFDEQFRLKDLEKEKVVTQNRIRIYVMLAGLGVFLAIGLILYRNNRQKQKANKVLETTLTNLKSTQSQLIQSEKMASLGELTAGIAHEIQNPLNFVNNFSEVNKELLIELKDEINKGNLEEVAAIADDLISNEDKINHHGKRADAIVKGMLAHSKSGTGKKELTNLNALTEEYLRLSFAGMQAKDKSFSATYKFEPDPNLPKMEVVPQDIGRVLLNLFNNALYAVQERSKNAEPGFTPEVLVTTGMEGNRVKLAIKDNGGGIPSHIKEKIFQPFFTTKPTGQGTGLGLSLSYDIVKAHGGDLKVETKVGEGSAFIIQLPIS